MMSEKERKVWEPFRIEEFEFEGQPANIVFPDKANEKKSWALKTEYRDAFPETELELLRRGYHVVFIKNISRFATKEDCDRKARLVAYLHENYGLSEKCVPVGMSCGGAHAVNFAGFHPECIQCLFIEAPVLNFLDYPGGFRNPDNRPTWWKEFKLAYPNMKRGEFLNFDNHPINKAPILIENKIPVLMVYGTEDIVVYYHENGEMLEEYYEDHPGLLTIMKRESQGHHPHGFPAHPEIIADWIEANS